MKTIPALATIAALVAFVLIAFSFVTSVSLLFAAGFGAIVVSDYGRTTRPIALRATAGLAARSSRERLGLAA